MLSAITDNKQNPSVEGTVGKIATAIIARCRKDGFYSFEALKTAVANKLYEFNHGAFQKREGSRYEVLGEELQYMRPLPSLPYEISEWVYGRAVNLDFHIVYKKNRYSCPYQYSKKKVDLKITDSTIEVYYKGDRITTHNRFPDYMKNKYSTHPEDMPPAFRDIVQWDDERIRNWAESIGSSTGQVIKRLFDSVDIKEQGYNPCLAVLRLSRTYTDARLETACELALSRGIKAPRYHHLKAILSTNQDIVYCEQKNTTSAMEDTPMGYLRGSAYYEKGGRGNAE